MQYLTFLQLYDLPADLQAVVTLAPPPPLNRHNNLKAKLQAKGVGLLPQPTLPATQPTTHPQPTGKSLLVLWSQCMASHHSCIQKLVSLRFSGVNNTPAVREGGETRSKGCPNSKSTILPISASRASYLMFVYPSNSCFLESMTYKNLKIITES